MTDFAALLRALAAERVEFILVGGAAATVHGSARLTRDLDVAYGRTAENLERLARALAPLGAYLRGAPPGLPFVWDADTIRRGLNFTLSTSVGDLDVLGEIVGGGTYVDLLPHSEKISVFGVDCHCLGLRKLIEVKRAAGPPKDLEAIAELEVILEESGGR